MDELQARHRKEQKELQGKITSKKKNATKKTRKGVNDECDRLEQELKEKQQAEIAALAPSSENEPSQSSTEVTELHLGNLSVNADDGGSSVRSEDQDSSGRPSHEVSIASENVGPKRRNRRKEQLARRAAEQEAQIEAAAEEAANMPDQRQQEMSAMKTQMESRGLVEIQIQPDGHCLYSACVKTIPGLEKKTYKDVRTVAAEYMNAHSEEFAPFLEEPMESYLHKVRDTAEWGGHLELQAIAKGYNVNIKVLQANGHVEDIQSDGKSEQSAWLAYYRHSFGLGEHYNALKETT